MNRSGLPSGRGGPHAFVADLARPVLDDGDRHHLDRVLRLRPGDPCTVSDGAGSWRPCRFGDSLAIDGDIVRTERPEPELTVGFSLLKGSRPELVVQKLTELGVDRIVAFVTERAVVHWDGDKRARNHQRWQRVAREAAMQSRQVWLPTVEPIDDFSGVAARAGAHLADLDADPIGPGVSCVLVGPEGGWADHERARLPRVGLGPHVLRAETAALAAAVRLTTLRELAQVRSRR